MKCTILHESKGRIRLHINNKKRMTIKEADVLSYYLNGIENVHQATVYERTCDIVVLYNDDRNAVLAALKNYNGQDEELIKQVPENTGRELNRMYQDKLVNMILFKAARSIFLPAPIIAAYTAVKSVKYIWKGIKCLFNKKLEVEVLDAVSIGVSIARLDFSTAGSVMFLLGIGELLEEWTRKKSIDDLARCMSLNVDRVWMKKDDTEVLVPVTQVRPGDLIVVHTGNLIPLDGKVVEGEASVNQASLTGESIAVMKSNGAYVYAGTVVEEGECVICVESQQGSSRYDNIVSMIENSEKLKSATESRAINLADKLVPYSLGGTALTYLITRNATKALSILMVDFSCALKLSMPLAVLSAMRECGTYKITVKGGKYLEAVAKADTIVFDKTGTLTYASPTVAEVIPFGGMDRDEVLKVAACLEEHYPHSMANAVVKEAAKEHINHEEMHSQVEYVVAHGISSIIEGKKTIIGSRHFVFEDEHATVPEGEEYKFENLPEQYSHLYLAIGGVLAGVVCISDPLREEAAAVLTSLKKLGIKKTVMMTGDNERTAAAIAKQVGVDMYYAEVLPEDKANFVESEKAEGRTVIMIGDGINDSPALSAADVGIAISDGAAIAREIADITVGADNLFELVMLKMIANGLQKRINSNYRFVIGFNSMLIALGVAGILPPATSALLHNVSTLGISVKSMTNLVG
ncbi:heavy metal translocating P-type ATPase [Anaerotignum sp. MSJ-24]|uniref:heavy metal translocating P-type ATPase n=1 Tax=Anaerotignum sp. MSJ-24 TaxID=2841521 RepID=UPI001C11E08C|nr:heavy metal translocating P-type ATPase [Anaerotignum sp. MSJ-24]MBU5464051.1 heavy metal translocating P-type ATPase [Anaerotignum sp. MSJ-24]